MGLSAARETYDRLQQLGCVSGSTIAYVNHFSHNGGKIYDELLPLAAAEGFQVSYDGPLPYPIILRRCCAAGSPHLLFHFAIFWDFTIPAGCLSAPLCCRARFRRESFQPLDDFYHGEGPERWRFPLVPRRRRRSSSAASSQEAIPPRPTTGIFTRWYTSRTILTATGKTAGPERPPVLLCRMGRRVRRSIRIPVRVLIRETQSLRPLPPPPRCPRYSSHWGSA